MGLEERFLLLGVCLCGLVSAQGVSVTTASVPTGVSVDSTYPAVEQPGGGIALVANPLLAASGGTAPYTWTISGGALPPGMTLTQAGRLGGIPTSKGSFIFTVKATDSASGSATKDFTITVVNRPVTKRKSNLNESLSMTVRCGTPGNTSFDYSSAGSLPAGMRFEPAPSSGDPLYTGIPTATGTYTVTWTCKNRDNGNTFALDTQFDIDPARRFILSGNVNRDFKFKVMNQITGTEPYTYQQSGGALPDGIQFTPATGELTGKPATAGESLVSFTRTDAQNVVRFVEYVFRINAAQALAPSVTAMSAKGETDGKPATQTVLIKGQPKGLGFTATASTTGGGNWLKVAPRAPAVIDGEMTVTVDPTGVAPGTYTGTVEVAPNPPDPEISTVSIPVTFDVTAPAPPEFKFDKPSLSFTVQQSQANPPSSTVKLSLVKGGGATTVSFTPKFSTSTQFFSLANGGSGPGYVNVKVTLASSLNPGTYSGLIQATWPGGTPVSLPVTAVVAALPRFVLPYNWAYIVVVEGEDRPGGEPVDFPFHTDPNQPVEYRTVDPYGAMQPPEWITSMIPALDAPNPMSASAGSIALLADTKDIPANIPGTPMGRPSQEYFFYVSSVSATPQQALLVSVEKIGDAPPAPDVPYVGYIYIKGCPNPPMLATFGLWPTRDKWYTISGGLLPEYSFLNLVTREATFRTDPLPVTVQLVPIFADDAKPGFYRGDIVYETDTDKPESERETVKIPFGVVIGAEGVADCSVMEVTYGPQPFSKRPQSPAARRAPVPKAPAVRNAACEATEIYLNGSPSSGFKAYAGRRVPLAFSAITNCLTRVTEGTLTAYFSNGDAPVNLAYDGAGSWTGTWVPARLGEEVQMKIEAESGNAVGTDEFTVSVGGDDTLPVFAANPVRSAAGMQGGLPVAPGQLVVLAGERLADATEEAVESPLPEKLAEVSVLLNGKALPLLKVSDTQIVGVLPESLEPGTRAEFLVIKNGKPLPPVGADVAATAPAIFTSDGTGTGQGEVYVVQDEARTPANAENAAAAGQTLIAVCTGLGKLTEEGAVEAPVKVLLNEQEIDATAASLGSGKYEVKFVLPEGLPASAETRLQIRAGDVVSEAVFFAVK